MACPSCNLRQVRWTGNRQCQDPLGNYIAAKHSRLESLTWGRHLASGPLSLHSILNLMAAMSELLQSRLVAKACIKSAELLQNVLHMVPKASTQQVWSVGEAAQRGR